MVQLSTYRPDDAPLLLALFRDTVRRVHCRDYSPAQVATVLKQRALKQRFTPLNYSSEQTYDDQHYSHLPLVP